MPVASTSSWVSVKVEKFYLRLLINKSGSLEQDKSDLKSIVIPGSTVLNPLWSKVNLIWVIKFNQIYPFNKVLNSIIIFFTSQCPIWFFYNFFKFISQLLIFVISHFIFNHFIIVFNIEYLFVHPMFEVIWVPNVLLFPCSLTQGESECKHRYQKTMQRYF